MCAAWGATTKHRTAQCCCVDECAQFMHAPNVLLHAVHERWRVLKHGAHVHATQCCTVAVDLLCECVGSGSAHCVCAYTTAHNADVQQSTQHSC